MKREEYLREWEKLGPIVVRMTRKDGRCKHALGDTFCFKNPYDKPKDLCPALWHVLGLYTWRVALGFPSWEADDSDIYSVHCPSRTGTVWEMRTARPEEHEEKNHGKT